MAAHRSSQLQQQRQILSSEEAATDMGVNVKRPKFPQYAMLEKRLESYKSWPSNYPLSPTTLAEAGLVFTGKGDSVRCYYCGGGLRSWEEGDSVWVEHAKWYPACPHVNMVKGASYVKGVKNKLIFTDDGFVEEKQAPVPNVEDLLMFGIAAESCLIMGLEKELVREAIKIYHHTHGHHEFRAEELAEIVFDLEDKRTAFPAPPRTQPIEAQKENIDILRLSQEDTCSTNVTDSKKVTINDQPEEVTEDLLREHERLTELKQCKICLDANSSIIFLPCGHMVSCPQCAPALIKCPVCRTQIKGTVKACFA